MKKLVPLVFLLIFVPLSLAAAKTKKFSKNYKNARLEIVLNDLCKHFGYELVADRDDVDLNQRVTASFKEVTASTVLRKTLNKDEYSFSIKKKKMTIQRKPVPPTVYTSVATVPSSIEENDTMKVTVWNDTSYSVTCKMVTQEVINEEAIRAAERERALRDSLGLPYKGHHIWFAIGGAYTDLGYALRDSDGQSVGKEHGYAGGAVSLQYAYFFTENWGVGAGVGFSHYTSFGTMDHSKRFAGQTDSDGESYTHIATTKGWKERQSAYMVDVPVEVLFHYPIRPTWGLYGGVGVKTGLILASDWRVKSGAVEHSGEYAQWGMTLNEVTSHDFYTEQASAFPASMSQNRLALQLPAIGVMADFGFSIRLTEQVNLLVGAFFNYTCNNVRPSANTEMGWQQTGYSGAEAYRNHSFMNTYAGEISSEYAQYVRPWEAGLKVGIDWRHKKKEKPIEKHYSRVQVCDTMITLAQRVDTVYKPKPVVKQQIVRLMETSVIWFDLDSSIPNLQPADILDKIAEILIENPRQKIEIHGHASKEGSARHNKRLSEARAQAIYKMLLDKGVPADQMTTRAYGIEKSYLEGEHEISLDRRVEIIPVNE